MGTEPDDLAYQVEKGDETVGIVLIRPEGDVTPPGMVGPYCDRLDVGFRRAGASYVLEL